MKVLAFSDLRTTESLPDVNPDLVILLGHIPSKKVNEIEQKYDCTILGLLSNSCSPRLYEDTTVVNLHRRVVDIEGIRFAGFGGVPLHNNDSFGYYSEEEVEKFVEQLSVSNVDVLISYANLAYGDIKGANAKDGFKAYNRIVIEGISKYIIHGRLYSDFKRKLGETEIFSVYPYKIITLTK
ncbi:metallophosphoesterase, calcineurin superfamily, putative [Lysinibacillus capsici]|uniref:Metallophosphoesterase, calcineurin superfamily, putative n=1 Tax=Lysinibacillus capsici TaxID=2115968 RepID=A0A2X1A990_9BACI|nr:hypothetical protein [Lysinibacillus capsici]SPU40737.1 metallophosphoesterase, calcineurin superfamily, putative [Lysinibacillus capsici]